MDKAIRILYMEDDHGLALLFRKKLAGLGFDIEVASDGTQGLAMLAEKDYDILVIDYHMPGHNGLEVIRALATGEPVPPAIMLTAAGSEEVAVEALKWGAADYVAKEPGYLDKLPQVIRQTLQHHNLLLEMSAAEQALQHSEATQRAMLQAMPDFIFQLNCDGIILSAKEARQGNFPFKGELAGKKLHTLLPQNIRRQMQEHIDAALADGEVQLFDFSIPHAEFTHYYENRIVAISETGVLSIFRDITTRVEAEKEKEWLLQEFQDALAKIKTLGGLIPICASCKKVRDDKGYWNQIEQYIQEHSGAAFSHGVCPECMEDLYPHMTKKK